MSQAITGGVIEPPRPMPRMVKLLPKPRCLVPIQLETILLLLGEFAASPTPTKKRTIINEPAIPTRRVVGRSGANPVRAVKVDHNRMATVRTSRGPYRSPAQPPGAWQIAYPKRKALNNQPMVCVLRESSS